MKFALIGMDIPTLLPTLLTDLLVRMGVSEETAAADACKLEHAISDESFRAIKRFAAELK